MISRRFYGITKFTESPKTNPGLALKRGAIATDYSNRCPNKNIIGPRTKARSVSEGIPINRANNQKTSHRFFKTVKIGPTLCVYYQSLGGKEISHEAKSCRTSKLFSIFCSILWHCARIESGVLPVPSISAISAYVFF